MVKNDSYYISSDNLTSRSDHGLDGLSGGGLLKHISDRRTMFGQILSRQQFNTPFCGNQLLG